jgi:hypothetical protein
MLEERAEDHFLQISLQQAAVLNVVKSRALEIPYATKKSSECFSKNVIFSSFHKCQPLPSFTFMNISDAWHLLNSQVTYLF